MGTETSRQLWGFAVNRALSVYIVWALYTGAIYLLSWLFNARGAPAVLLKHVAWGLFPMLVGYVVYGFGLVVTVTLIDVDTALPGIAAENTAFLLDQVLTHPIMILVTVVFVGSIVWSAYLLVYAAQEARSLPRSAAWKVVAVPTAGYALYVLWDLVSRLGIV
jgi:hypothetical protein